MFEGSLKAMFAATASLLYPLAFHSSDFEGCFYFLRHVCSHSDPPPISQSPPEPTQSIWNGFNQAPRKHKKPKCRLAIFRVSPGPFFIIFPIAFPITPNSFLRVSCTLSTSDPFRQLPPSSTSWPSYRGPQKRPLGRSFSA